MSTRDVATRLLELAPEGRMREVMVERHAAIVEAARRAVRPGKPFRLASNEQAIAAIQASVQKATGRAIEAGALTRAALKVEDNLRALKVVPFVVALALAAFVAIAASNGALLVPVIAGSLACFLAGWLVVPPWVRRGERPPSISIVHAAMDIGSGLVRTASFGCGEEPEVRRLLEIGVGYWLWRDMSPRASTPAQGSLFGRLVGRALADRERLNRRALSEIRGNPKRPSTLRASTRIRVRAFRRLRA